MADMPKMKGLGGMGRMGAETERKPKPMGEKKEMEGEHTDETGTKTHTIEEHPDGHFETHMHDGTHEEHPDHLHMLAHIGHHVTGGDKHHVMHHDGMSATSHMIHENGEHEDHGEHNTAEEAKDSLDKFFGEEAEEPQHEHGPGQEEEMPAYGGM